MLSGLLFEISSTLYFNEGSDKGAVVSAFFFKII